MTTKTTELSGYCSVVLMPCRGVMRNWGLLTSSTGNSFTKRLLTLAAEKRAQQAAGLIVKVAQLRWYLNISQDRSVMLRWGYSLEKTGTQKNEMGTSGWIFPEHINYEDSPEPSEFAEMAYPSLIRESTSSPGWCGSVDWVLACKPKGSRFNSQSGHMPGLWARSPVGRHARGNHTLIFLSLSFSLSSPLIKNK